MNIDFLQNIIDVANLNSITKASVKGNISQAALSQQIQTIEKNLGVKLFNRTYKGVELTDTGKIVYSHAVEITTSYNMMLKKIASFKNNEKNLHVIATAVICTYALPCTVYKIKNKFPDYILQVEAKSSAEIEEKIMHGVGDIGIIVGKPENKSLFNEKIFADKYYLVSAMNMKIPDKITFKELCNYPMIRLSKNQKTRKLINDFLQDRNMDSEQINSLYELDSIDSIKTSILSNNDGIAFLPRMSIKKEIYANKVKIIKLDNFDYECPYYILKRRNDYALEEKSNIIANFAKTLTDCVYN